MPTMTFADPGTDATGDLSFWTGLNVTGDGAIVSSTHVAHTGTRSLRFTGTSGIAYISTPNGVLSDTGFCISQWYYFDVLPGTDSQFCAVEDSGGTSVFEVTIGNSGTGHLAWSVNGSFVKFTNTTLVTGQWYQVVVSGVITATNNYTVKCFINNTFDSTLSNADVSLARTGSSRFAIYFPTTTFDCSIDNTYIDSRSDLTDPGGVRVTAKRPAANNVNQFDTAIGANPANRWTNVNEVPISQTNGWQHTASTDVQENYTLEAPGVGDVNLTGATILGRTAWIYAKGTAGGLGTPKIMDNGVESAIALTASPALYTKTTTSATYPSNAAGIGMRSTFNADDTFLYDCGQIIAYIPGPVPIFCYPSQ